MKGNWKHPIMIFIYDLVLIIIGSLIRFSLAKVHLSLLGNMIFEIIFMMSSFFIFFNFIHLSFTYKKRSNKKFKISSIFFIKRKPYIMNAKFNIYFNKINSLIPLDNNSLTQNVKKAKNILKQKYDLDELKNIKLLFESNVLINPEYMLLSIMFSGLVTIGIYYTKYLIASQVYIVNKTFDSTCIIILVIFMVITSIYVLIVKYTEQKFRIKFILNIIEMVIEES